MTSDSFPAFQAATDGDAFQRGVVALTESDLPADGVLIDVQWSSVNYKDALASISKGRVARISPIVPGVDLAGTLSEALGDLPAGTAVLAHGYDIGVARHGGYAAKAKVPAEWIVELPAGLTTRDAMVIGTAGFTAAMSVMALQAHGITPQAGPVLVTGATGGVGSVAVNLLSGAGYEVVASTGKAASHDYLRSIGASSIVDRATLSEAGGRPLQKPVWAAAVDCVGGDTLANVLSRIDYGGAVAASGLTGGANLATTVMPFILRGVCLLGIDSVQTPMEVRREVWARIGSDLMPTALGSIAHQITLAELDGVLAEILKGGLSGRYVVSPSA